MKILLKAFLGAGLLLGLSSAPSSATILFPVGGDFGTLSTPGVDSLPIAGVTNGAFKDTFYFYIPQMDTVSIKFGSSYSDKSQFITSFMTDLYSGSSPSSSTFITSAMAINQPSLTTPNAGGETGVLADILSPGHYSFIISGTSGDKPAYGTAISIAVSSVPVPASLPLFGVAILSLAGFSYGMNRWVAPKAKATA